MKIMSINEYISSFSGKSLSFRHSAIASHISSYKLLSANESEQR